MGEDGLTFCTKCQTNRKFTKYATKQEALGHRILAAHGPGETCDKCPCWHCGADSDPDGDHSCPCPHHDNDCPWHTEPKGAA